EVLGDPVLDGEEVVESDIYLVGPESRAGGNVDQLYRDADPVSGPLDLAVEDGFNRKRASGLDRVLRLASERADGGRRPNRQLPDPAQPGNEGIREREPEILVPARPRKLLERQDGDRPDARDCLTLLPGAADPRRRDRPGDKEENRDD